MEVFGPITEVPRGLREPELRMMVGIPGSGKSHLAIWWLETGQVDGVVSSDQIRQAITGDAGDISHDKDVWPCFYSQLEDALDENLRVVADATNLTPKTWAKIVEVADKYDLTPEAHVMRTPHGTSIERNRNRKRKVPDDVMWRMVGNYDEWVRNKVLAQHGFEVIEHFC